MKQILFLVLLTLTGVFCNVETVNEVETSPLWDVNSFNLPEAQFGLCTYSTEDCYCYILNGVPENGLVYMIQSEECLSELDEELEEGESRVCLLKAYSEEPYFCFDIYERDFVELEEIYDLLEEFMDLNSLEMDEELDLSYDFDMPFQYGLLFD